MEWGIVAIAVVFVIVAYIVVQGTRASLAWRRAAARGDVDVIRQLLEDAIDTWGSMKRPKEVAPDVWRGVQSVELVEAGPAGARVSCQVESQYRQLAGRWVEVASPLEEGMAVTVRLVDMLLYDVPNLRLESARVDVYTTFRDQEGRSQRACILSTSAGREAAREVDWEGWSAAEVVDALGGRYRLSDRGGALPIELEDEAAPAEAQGLGARLER